MVPRGLPFLGFDAAADHPNNGNSNNSSFSNESGGAVQEIPIVLEVDSPNPRIELATLAAGGACLVAGQRQWLGLCATPGRDSFQNGGRLTVSWPLPPTVADIARKVSGLLGLQSPANSAGLGLASTEIALAATGAAAAAVAASTSADPTSPVLLPQHAAAVVACGGDALHHAPQLGLAAGGGKGVIVKSSRDGARSSAHPWTDDGVEEIELPLQRQESRNTEGGCPGGSTKAPVPVTVWWWVDVGPYSCPPEHVHVAPPEPVMVLNPSSFGLAGGGGATPNAVRVGIDGTAHTTATTLSPSDPLCGPSSTNDWYPATIDLPVTLQYVCGCQRTHTTLLSVAVQQPFSVKTSAQELSSGIIVVNFALSSRLPYPITITEATMAPQPGLLLQSSAVQEVGLLPLTVPPRGHLAMCFSMKLDTAIACGDRASAQAKLRQAAKLQPSSLMMTYAFDEDAMSGCPVTMPDTDWSLREGSATGYSSASHHHYRVHAAGGAAGGGGGGGGAATHLGHLNRVSMTARGVAAAALAHAAAAAAGALGVHLPTSDELRQLREASRPQSAGSSSFSAGGGGAGGDDSCGSGSIQVCTFSHACALELPTLDADLPDAVVLVRLLGPFTAIAGQPVSMYWRLERAGLPEMMDGNTDRLAPTTAGLEDGEPSRLHFEVVSEGDSWQPMGRRSGAVTLDAYDGALATVEVTLIPLAGGTLPVPSLRLINIPYQELFDVGTGGNYVVVTPPSA